MSNHALVGFLAVIFLSAPALGQDNPSIDAAMRARVVNGVAEQVEANFYDSGLGAEIATDLRARLANGEFDDAADAASLSDQLTAILYPSDSHFAVRYFGPPPPTNGAGQPDQRGNPFAAGSRVNYGFQEVSILPGNVGYIDMRLFFPVQQGGDTALAALNFIEHTDAVIFDMRQNGGGTPQMVQFLISHFLDPNSPTVINTFRASNRDYPGELLSLAYLPGAARPDVPLYVLTSSRTGSAGEAFPYHLQAMERATIVGETTYGAGNPGGFVPAGEGFGVFVSNARTQNPVTGTNWEGVGVVPDVATTSDDALETALGLAYGAILETAEEPGHRQSIEWAREVINARLDPPAFDVAANMDIAGQYGERRIYAEDGTLFYRRGDQSGRPLIYLGDDRFMIEGLEDIRVTIQRQNNRVISISLQQAGGPADVSMRTGD
ncbi:MAG: hypothetical protein DHS20C06_00530 [Hyphobacterium sp.]|nr:MAG: hypothetical protein DHS20C06_00530 [Hyphobacterium sp.]